MNVQRLALGVTRYIFYMYTSPINFSKRPAAKTRTVHSLCKGCNGHVKQTRTVFESPDPNCHALKWCQTKTCLKPVALSLAHVST